MLSGLLARFIERHSLKESEEEVNDDEEALRGQTWALIGF